MTIQGAIYELNNMLYSNDIPCYWKPAIKKIIETVEQTEQNVGMCQQNVGEMSEKQTDGDLISRVKDIISNDSNLSEAQVIDLLRRINELPSAEKTEELQPIVRGKWINKGDMNDGECSVCRKLIRATDSANFNYCPNCGAKMEME